MAPGQRLEQAATARAQSVSAQLFVPRALRFSSFCPSESVLCCWLNTLVIQLWHPSRQQGSYSLPAPRPTPSLSLVHVPGFGPSSSPRREVAGDPLTLTKSLKAFSGIPADGPRPGGEPPVTFLRTEEGPDASFPRTIPLIQQLLNATELTQDPAAYSRLVAVLVYTAERAKFATGGERQDWMDLFIDTFKLVHRDIVGDPETALALC